mgnify:CR=1 FL=1
MEKSIRSCKFNMNSGCVKIEYLDGSVHAIDCTAVENQAADNRF